MAGIKGLLGETVQGKVDEPVLVESFSGPGKIVGLYFSAHWCLPCKAFTPTLVAFYNKLKSHGNKPLEIVFLSSDRDDESFKEYYAEMPWLAVPREDIRRHKLSQRYKVRGIPTLVLLDGDTGEVITKDGRSVVISDPDGADYPWPKPKFADIMNGKTLINRENKEFDANEALRGNFKGLYFSAHWCPPCRGFTPELVKCYNKIRAAGKKFEIVFVTSDRDEKAFQEYLNDMPWLAVPFGSEAHKKLDVMFKVDGIPTLILLDENDEVITENGRGAVGDDPEGKDFPWAPKPVNNLSSEAAYDALNDGPCVLFISKEEEEKEKKEEVEKAMMDAMQDTAEKYVKNEDGPKFFYGFSNDEVLQAIFAFLGIRDPDFPLLIVVNLPEQWKNVKQGVKLTKEEVEDTLSKYDASTLVKEPIRS